LLKEVQAAGDLEEVVLAVAAPVEVVALVAVGLEVVLAEAAGGLAKCSCDP
jgi:hypothetical protein